MGDKRLNRKLYDAVKENDCALVNKLLGQNADPNAPVGKNKMTCMARAAAPHRSREIENALVTAGGVPDRLSSIRRQPNKSAARSAIRSSLMNTARGSLGRMSWLAGSVQDSLLRSQRKVLKLSGGDMLLEESSGDNFDDASVDVADVIKALPPAMAQTLSRKKNWEYDRSKLEIQEVLGEGMFGCVSQGIARGGLVAGEAETRVAVKQLMESAGSDVAKEFDKEVHIMKALSGCSKVVSLLGVCTQSQPHLMLMELMPRGDLKTALRASRPKASKPSPLSLRHLVTMLNDIAQGMEFLSKNNVVHRDLAARNCMVADDYGVKIGDFGLTRKLYTKDYYRQNEADCLPVRWMSPEALQDGVFTTAGDVWSFGVVLWEVVSFAKLPYSLWTNHEVYENVCDEDYRLPCPKECPANIFALTRFCWEEEPQNRATFAQLVQKTGDLIPRVSTDPISKGGKHRKGATSTPVPKSKPESPPPAIDDGGDGHHSDDSFDDLSQYVSVTGEVGAVFYEAAMRSPSVAQSPPSGLVRKATVWERT
eukprot:m.102954 g.102954  ORF g.102954 m.102954 type:complete len:537 (+) comp16831_c0_seq4:261-1871(+)